MPARRACWPEVAGIEGCTRDAMTPDANERKRQNRRLGLILASVALAFFVGIVVRRLWFGH